MWVGYALGRSAARGQNQDGEVKVSISMLIDSRSYAHYNHLQLARIVKPAIDRPLRGQFVTSEDGHASDTFVEEVHSALLHTYDPTHLRHSPLLAELALDKGRNPVATLARILAETIQTLKPAAGVPADSGAWRNYRLLTHRFLDHISQKQAALDL